MTREEYIAKIKQLNDYTKLYDEGNPAISDEEWDIIYFDCQKFEEETGYVDPASPTSSIQFDVKNNLKKVTHNHPMLSLDKTKDIDVLRKWIKEPTITMLKMDGLTVSIRYVNGKLVSAETRGDGVVGEDITENIKRLPSVPKTIPTKEETIIDGEVICKYDDFEQFSDMYKNPRNFASGSIRLDDPDECEKRCLTYVGWDIISSKASLKERLETLADLNFISVCYEVTDVENLEEQQSRLKALAAEKNFPIDGLVYKINDYESYMAKGRDNHSFLGGLAFKFYDALFETELTGITWSVAKTGRITPVATFKPVEIDGTTIKNASMHNLTIMKKLLGDTPHVGQKIWIIKANCIIPQVVKAEKNN